MQYREVDDIQGNVQLGEGNAAIILRAELIPRLQISVWLLSRGHVIRSVRLRHTPAASPEPRAAHHVGNLQEPAYDEQMTICSHEVKRCYLRADKLTTRYISHQNASS